MTGTNAWIERTKTLLANATGGAWRVVRGIHEDYLSILSVAGHASQDVLIVNVGDGGLGAAQHQRNADLIAQAPELLREAVESLEALQKEHTTVVQQLTAAANGCHGFDMVYLAGGVMWPKRCEAAATHVVIKHQFVDGYCERHATKESVRFL